MVICYVAIYFKVRKVRKELENCFGNIESIYKEEDLQLLKMIGIILATFIICFTAGAAREAVFNFGRRKVKEIWDFGMAFLFWLNYVINPLIYGFKNKVYRPAFISLYQKFYKYFCNMFGSIPPLSS